MRILKLAIWDLDETLLKGIFIEGDKEAGPFIPEVVENLHSRGVLQALATQNPPEIKKELQRQLPWLKPFIRMEVDLLPKAAKVKHILDHLRINPLDTVFIDQDPFERDSIAYQIPGITTWTVEKLKSYLEQNKTVLTKEGKQRPRMYREQQSRAKEQEQAGDYGQFLYSCNIHLLIRPYLNSDEVRVKELLTRTHRMNLGVLSIEEAFSRIKQTDTNSIIIAELKDRYGDMGRCGILHLSPQKKGEALIESLAISCRTRARGLSLAMLAGMLKHPHFSFDKYLCRYQNNGVNRPLRMLLMGARFRPQKDREELLLSRRDLDGITIPGWVHISYQNNKFEVNIGNIDACRS